MCNVALCLHIMSKITRHSSTCLPFIICLPGQVQSWVVSSNKLWVQIILTLWTHYLFWEHSLVGTVGFIFYKPSSFKLFSLSFFLFFFWRDPNGWHLGPNWDTHYSNLWVWSVTRMIRLFYLWVLVSIILSSGPSPRAKPYPPP